ncbi:hypothetical protein D3870_06075 [Noviherbaspirillum cavernae]|uniref:Uncharacterized protein n=1 Tax=Noviherbaspirillum cavernae TaxID=2320862 RepID=A0A418WZZ8_9BURK|nr:hypothetical protein [Noviherbaspirillum cavernae]RJG05645.1 hypothetical protein D3870_06075 [Noviherbaspirillum cavernae]
MRIEAGTGKAAILEHIRWPPPCASGRSGAFRPSASVREHLNENQYLLKLRLPKVKNPVASWDACCSSLPATRIAHELNNNAITVVVTLHCITRKFAHP